MNKTLRKFILIAFVISAVVCVAGAAIIYLVNRSQSAKAVGYAPPDVQISSPEDGTEIDSGSIVSVSAIAQSTQPVTRAELWVDGELLATQDPDNPNGDSPLYAHFPLLVQAGNHLVFVRALNSAGIVGQSMPISINGVKPVNVTDEGQTTNAPPPSGQPNASTGTTGPVTNPAKTGTIPSTGNTANPAGGGGVAAPAGGGANPPLPNTPPLAIISPAVLTIPIASTPPSAPTDLIGKVDNCQLTLFWNDNASDESHYEIWIAGNGQLPWLYETLSSNKSLGGAWAMLAAPNPGTYSVWVEAVNPLGHTLSNMAKITVPNNCPDTIPKQLDIQATQMTVPGNVDLVYCYVSFNGANAVRIPADPTKFITAVGGTTDIGAYAAGPNRKMVIPWPAGNTLAMHGECDGWTGGAYTKLGAFNTSFTSDKWNGLPQKVTLGSSYVIIVITTQPTTQKNTISGFTDPTMPMVYDFQIARVGDPNGDAAQKYMWENQRKLIWGWSGDKTKIVGFAIYMDGKPYKMVPKGNAPSHWVATVFLPPACSTSSLVRWQVKAVGLTGTDSALSLPVMLDCAGKVFVEVRFAELGFSATNNGKCDTLNVYGSVELNGETLPLWSPSHPVEVNCSPLKLGTYAGEPGTKSTGLSHPNTFQKIFDGKKPIQLNMHARFSQTFDSNCIGNNCAPSPPDQLIYDLFTKQSWEDYEHMRKKFPDDQEKCFLLPNIPVNTGTNGGVLKLCIRVTAAQ
jgi:hypothetical protein